MLISDPQEITRLQTFKGWFFVIVTAVLLFGLIRQGRQSLLRSREDLLGSQEDLRERARQLEASRREAREERNRLQALIDTAPIGIAFYSAPGRCPHPTIACARADGFLFRQSRP
jgi:hypothetical protein